MARKRYKPEEIVAKMRQVDVLVSQGQTMVGAIRQIGVSEVTYYRWRQEFGGLKSDSSSSENLTACRLAGHRVIEDARSQVTRRRGGHNRQELTHAAFKATEATAPEATEAATTTASGIAGTPSFQDWASPIATSPAVTSHCPLCEAAPCSEPPSEPRCPRGIGASASKIEKPRDKDSPRR
jgi:hypothetical protein